MASKDQLNADLRESLRGRDDTRRDTIRLVLSAIHNAEIAAGRELDENGINGVLAREARQRRESIEEFRKGGRSDLVAREEAELAVVLQYMPPQMSRDDIVAAARRVIGQVGAKGPADRGKVMSTIMGELRGKADGAEINAIVTELLAQA